MHLYILLLLFPLIKSAAVVFREEVCKSNFVDIRNDPTSMGPIPSNYKTCTVLEGSFGNNK
jgi:hypothetical protein